jgi:hypothetical protein
MECRPKITSIRQSENDVAIAYLTKKMDLTHLAMKEFVLRNNDWRMLGYFLKPIRMLGNGWLFFAEFL